MQITLYRGMSAWKSLQELVSQAYDSNRFSSQEENAKLCSCGNSMSHLSDEHGNPACCNVQQQESEYCHSRSIVLMQRGVGLLQQCSAQPVPICAAYISLSATCFRTIAITSMDATAKEELMRKACQAADKACFVMGMMESDTNAVANDAWNQVASLQDTVEHCFCEAALLNLDACLSACSCMLSSACYRFVPGVERCTKVPLKSATNRQLQASYSAAQRICCDAHPLNTDAKLYLEVHLLSKLSSMASAVDTVSEEIQRFILHRCDILMMSDPVVLNQASDLKSALQATINVMHKHDELQASEGPLSDR